MRTINDWIQRGLYGIGIGTVIYVISLIAQTGINDSSKVKLVLIIFCAICGNASIIFELEYWNPLIRRIVHFTVCFVLSIIANVCLGYVNDIIRFSIMIFPKFLFIYGMMSCSYLLYNYLAVKQINRKLKDRINKRT